MNEIDLVILKRGCERILKKLEAFKAGDPERFKFWNYMPIERFQKLFCELCVLRNQCTFPDDAYSCYLDAFLREAKGQGEVKA